MTPRPPFDDRYFEDASLLVVRDQAAREAHEEQDFVNRVNRFAKAWNRMLVEYCSKHAINVKLLKEIGEAYSALESYGWPKRSK